MAQHGTKAKGGKEYGAAGRKAEGKGLRQAAKRDLVRREQELRDEGKLVRMGNRCSNCRRPLVADRDNLELSACLRCELPVTWDLDGAVACSECELDIKRGDQVVDLHVWNCDGTLKSIELLHEGCER